ncbi:type II secretion system minor pseudopilin GspK [Alkalimonas collagenimarina]|uniref:Type II secretion system protein K n=1 Tax=Alkalimonas collagenimarina TaxID=400390 RepID=A0ABT9GY45_9GAMM|nr:type II secretion system minor pseudopilin GspK [Alkalimonas collagenimarina]MDP4535615.1 type II secretion system minor pseudopilin GspK [Alkalimonas collagenimarina]
MMHLQSRQRGVALVMVLMIVAIVVVIAVNMSGRLQLTLQRQQNLQQQQQAFWYAMGTEAFARQVLRRSLQGQETAHLGQDWALQGAVFPVPDGTISGVITDLQSCFNLNALYQAADPSGQMNTEATPAQQSFQRLLELVATDLSMPAEFLMARIADWLDEDTLLRTAGSAEDDDYAALVYPYYAGNTLMATETELRAIYQITPDDYKLLQPYICVIPDEQVLQLNVNTLTEDTAILLSALVAELDPSAAMDLVANRPDNGFESVDEFWGSGALAGIEVDEAIKELVTVSSSYFKLTARIGYQESGMTMESVLKVHQDQGVTIMSRRLGGAG